VEVLLGVVVVAFFLFYYWWCGGGCGVGVMFCGWMQGCNRWDGWMAWRWVRVVNWNLSLVICLCSWGEGLVGVGGSLGCLGGLFIECHSGEMIGDWRFVIASLVW